MIFRLIDTVQEIVRSVAGATFRATVPLLQPIINEFGDIFGYDRCPWTKDSYLGSETDVVPYANKRNVVVLVRAFSERVQRIIPIDEALERVKKRGEEIYGVVRSYSIDEIKDKIMNRIQIYRQPQFLPQH